MAKKNLPAYVRLPAEGEVLPVGILADIDGGTHWSISGLDVRPVPEDDDPAQRFVRKALNDGLLEEATAAEFKVVQNAQSELAKLAPNPSDTPKPWDEPAIANAARRHRAKIVAARVAGAADDADDDEGGDEDLSKLSVDELKQRLSTLGEPVEGKKAELVTRLEEAVANA